MPKPTPTPKGTAAAHKAWDTIRRKQQQQNDQLPPHDEDAEEGALSCVLQAGDAGSQQNVESFLHQLRPWHFYVHRCKTLYHELNQMAQAGVKLDTVSLRSWLKNQKVEGQMFNKLEECGGLAFINHLISVAPSMANFPYYWPILENFRWKRWSMQAGTQIIEHAKSENFSMEKAREFTAEIHDRAVSMANDKAPLIHVVSPAQARAYEPEPADYLIGDGLITRGAFVVIAGVPGVGKSRLATTLAVAGARGNSNWMHLPVRSQWRTLILQAENSSIRLKKEFSAVPQKFNDFIRISDGLSHGLAFDKPEFRREVRRIHDDWPFEMLVVDPWNKVSSEDGQKDYMEALYNVESCFRGCKRMPCIVIVAHLRKKGRDDKNTKPKGGRDLLDEIAGSLGLGSTARSVFTVRPVTADQADYRIVFDIAKNNDDETVDSKQTRSAWMRANAAFEAIPNFDWNEFDNPGDPDRRTITEDDLKMVFAGEKEMKAGTLAKKLKVATGVGESTAYRAIGLHGYLSPLLSRDPLGCLSLKNGHANGARV